MEHRAYNLDTNLKILGLGVGDVGAIVVTWFVTFQIFGAAFPPRIRLVVAAIVTFAVFQLWVRVKDRAPSNFLAHFAAWLGERPCYEVTHDTEPQPCVVHYKTVDQMRARRRHAQRLVRAARRQRAKSPPAQAVQLDQHEDKAEAAS